MIVCAALASAAATRAPEVIWVNGNIHTLDPSRPRAESIAVVEGRIARIGSTSDVRAESSPDAVVIDLGGATVVPGLIDAHGHIGGLGSYVLGRLDLRSADSFDDVIAIVAERVRKAKPGEWIVGGRWDHENWPGGELPTHESLSAVSPNNPVWLTRVDGHAGLANAAAMRAAGVTRATQSPPGGEVLRDAAGEPTGIFVDAAEGLIERHAPPPADFAALVLAAQKQCLALGLTGVHDAGASPAEIEVYRALERDGRLRLRVYVMVHGSVAPEYFRKHGTYAGPRLTVRACKLYADGALGSRGAWLLQPYADRATDDAGEPYAGLALTPAAQIEAIALDALRQGYQVCTHAIGDRANREVLTAYAAAMRRQGGVAAPRFRIEHAQLISLDDIPRFAELSVIASVQPTHCTTDMRWVDQRIGPERVAGAYAWAKLLRSGARIAAGSDFPVESPNPMLGLYAAVTRQDAGGQPSGGWRPEDRLTREEALRAFTVDAAYAEFAEDRRGMLSPGRLADFVVLDRDVLACEAKELPATRVQRTVIEGQTVYDASSATTDTP